MTALVHYTTMIFFPGGGVAAGAKIRVALDGSNVAPLIYQDVAGTVPQANPIVADSLGRIGFYGAPGLWTAELSGTVTRVDVDPAWPGQVHPDVHVHVQTVAAATWTVDHFFGGRPSVAVYTLDDEEVAHVSYPSPTRTVIDFSAPHTGTATLRR